MAWRGLSCRAALPGFVSGFAAISSNPERRVFSTGERSYNFQMVPHSRPIEQAIMRLMDY